MFIEVAPLIRVFWYICMGDQITKGVNVVAVCLPGKKCGRAEVRKGRIAEVRIDDRYRNGV